MRIVAWLAIVPPFAGRSVPMMAKVVLSLGLAFAVAPQLADGSIGIGNGDLVLNVVTQVLVGTAMGFVTYLLFAAVAAAGSLIDVFGGFSLAQGFDPLSMNMNTVFGKFHQLLATMLLFATGGHLLVIGGLLKTFDVLPLGEMPDVSGAPDVLITAFGVFFVTAVQIALPMIAVLFVADLGLALLTKVAPQLQAINVMFPAKIGLTLLLLGLSFPVLPEAVRRLADLANQAHGSARRERGDADERGEDREADTQEEEGVAQGGPGPADPGARRLGLACSSSAWRCPPCMGRELTALRELMVEAFTMRRRRHRRGGHGAAPRGRHARPVHPGAAGLGRHGDRRRRRAGPGRLLPRHQEHQAQAVQARPDQGRQADLRSPGALGGREDAAQERRARHLPLHGDQGR